MQILEGIRAANKSDDFSLGDFRFKGTESEADLTAAFRLRYRVLVEEEGVIPADSFPDKEISDSYDVGAVILGAFDSSGELAGTIRLIFDPQIIAEQQPPSRPSPHSDMYQYLLVDKPAVKRVVNVNFIAVSHRYRNNAKDIYYGFISVDKNSHENGANPSNNAVAQDRHRGLIILLGMFRLAYQKAKLFRAQYMFQIANSRLQNALENTGIHVMPIGEELPANSSMRGSRPCLIKFQDVERSLGIFSNVKLLAYALTRKFSSILQFRSDFRKNEIPAAYSGVRHFLFTSSFSLTGIIGALALVRQPSWRELLIVPMTFLYAMLAEYLGHRGPMHIRLKFLDEIYKHTTIHHFFFTYEAFGWGSARDFNALLLPWQLLLFFFGFFAVPVGAVLFFLTTPNVAYLFVGTALAYFLNYEWLHFLYHSSDKSWAARIPLLSSLRRHHLVHHHMKLMSRFNFNITYPIFDALFGTTFKGDVPSTR